MSIYLAARLQQARRKKANAYKSACALLSFVVTTAATLVVWPFNSNTELALPPLAISAPAQVASIAPTGYAAMFDQAIFDGSNREAKIERATGPTAVEIANSFGKLRFAMLEAQTKLPKFVAQDSLVVASIPQKSLAKTKQTFDVVAQPMPKTAALDAIVALDDIGDATALRDPLQPYPVSVPTKLAYARDNAPSLKDFTPTLTQASMDANKKQLWCLASAIYFEARGESYRGQVAVAQVVRNRVKSEVYPNSICSVVFQNQSWKNRCQFSFACDGVPERVNEKKAWKQAEEIAKKVVNGDIYLAEVANATNYHANYVRPKWASELKKLTQIGVHIFYRAKNG